MRAWSGQAGESTAKSKERVGCSVSLKQQYGLNAPAGRFSHYNNKYDNHYSKPYHYVDNPPHRSDTSRSSRRRVAPSYPSGRQYTQGGTRSNVGSQDNGIGASDKAQRDLEEEERAMNQPGAA